MQRIIIATPNSTFNQQFETELKESLPEVTCIIYNNATQCLKDIMETVQADLAIVDSVFEAEQPNFFQRLLDMGIPPVALIDRLDADDYGRLSNSGIIDFQFANRPETIDTLIQIIQRLIKNKTRTICLVDDNKSLRKILKRMLEAHQFNIIEAASGEEGIQVILEQRPHLVISDYNMTGITGVEMIQEIRKTLPKEKLPILGLSANDAPHLGAEFIRSGANDFLSKPPKMDELFCRMNQNIEILERTQSLERSANYDYLTQLLNRRAFFQKAQRKISTTTCFIMMMDLDFFKKVNDTYGHDMGDYILKSTAESMSVLFGDQDIIARFGGEEFVVLLQADSIIQAYSVVENFRKTLASMHFSYQNNTISQTVSIGLCPVNESIAEALMRADELVYKSKENGRNQVSFSQ